MSHDTTFKKTLPDLNISRDQSSRWQKLAANPQSVKQYLKQSAAHGATRAARRTAGAWRGAKRVGAPARALPQRV